MNILRNEARRAYIKLIFNAKSKSEERNVDLNGYYEIHHIFPKSIYPEYVSNKHNLIKLTYKEHFIAHKLLAEFIPCYSTKFAFAMMGCVVNDKQKRVLEEITPEEYELCRKARIDAYKNRTEEEEKKILYDKVNETIHSKYKKEEITEFHRKGWETVLKLGKLDEMLEKRKQTISNFNEEQLNCYIEQRKIAGKCGNTNEAKVKRKTNNIQKFGGNGGPLNDELILEKFRNTLKNRDEKITNEWKHKCSLSCKGKHCWTDGIVTIISDVCPGEGFHLGRGLHKKPNTNFKNGKNPNSIKIEIAETNEKFDCIKDLCTKYNIKISIIRKFSIKESKRYWKISKNILDLYKGLN